MFREDFYRIGSGADKSSGVFRFGCGGMNSWEGGIMRLGPLLLLMAIAWCLPGSAGAVSRCLVINGTADALIKRNAVQGSLDSLQEAIDKWKAENGVTGPIVQTADRPNPHPFWRSSVSPDLFLPPDIITDTTYTICWKGVVSPVVCTTGAKVCW
jgi:hypothetical protein